MSHTPGQTEDVKEYSREELQTVVNALTARIHELENQNADLLEACQMLARWDDQGDEPVKQSEIVCMTETIQKARAAITKATGGEIDG